MTFRDAAREARIEGSMRWLELGLRAWLRSSSSVFIVAGESVWQTPDIVLTPIDDDLELNFRYRRPIRLRAAMPEVRAAVVDWTSRFAAEYERRLAALV